MLVIFNPVAGRRRAAALWKVLDLLVENGVKVEVAETQHAGHATELAREAARRRRRHGGRRRRRRHHRRGGERADRHDYGLGVIPLGTANVLAKEYRLSTSPRGIANALAYKRTALLWPGSRSWTGGEHVFVQMVGLGFDGAVVQGMQPLLKRAIGRGAYVWQSLWESLAYGFPLVHLTVDGVAHEAASVVVSKGRLYGGPYMLAPDARPDGAGISGRFVREPRHASRLCSPALRCRSACCRAAPACASCPPATWSSTPATGRSRPSPMAIA